ncbi:MAG: UDP-3-O-acyl-N-acetylglucosamine deacetylase [Planctomycetota bacterium]|nr:UDP-3-O-acyl-N-acetylglucosamine deacetylase [Planctomycetota bacterium]
MRRLQRTIKKPASVQGVGVFSGNKVSMRFLPAVPDSGVTFVRLDLPERPRIKVDQASAGASFRRRTLKAGEIEIETVEHVLAAIAGLAIDNLEIEIDGSEMPATDGSSVAFVEALKEAEIIEQAAPKKVIVLPYPLSVTEGDSTLVAMPADSGLTITYTLDYKVKPIGLQHLTVRITEETFMAELARARTFCLESEVQEFLQKGLGKGASYENTLVVSETGVVKNELRFPDEFVRHKMLDLLGDLYLLGGFLRAHVMAVKSGHSLNLQLVKDISAMFEAQTRRGKEETALDMREIQNILPHRFPFLLVDKVLELDGYNRAVGIKNVSFNEPFFQGHFPGTPIMPGVLQLEAMAQLAGVLLLRKAENAGKLAVLLSIDKVKLRKTVVPGDQLRLEAETIKLKSRTGLVYVKASVDGQLASEAYMKFMIVDSD